MNNQLEKVATELNEKVALVIGASTVTGFQKAYLYAEAISELKKLLTPEYMKPIMELQGNKLGFRTDKDRNKDGSKGPGYPEEIVKNCLIEAVLFGLQPHDNQFNIIAGNMYATKEGCGYILSNITGLSYQIIPSLPRINAESTSAAIDMVIKWSYKGENKEQILPVPVKMNAFMGTDAVIGKATRKARAWLISTITGNEMPEGNVEDQDAKIISTKININKEEERIKLMISDCETLEDLELIQNANPDIDISLINEQKEKINAKR